MWSSASAPPGSKALPFPDSCIVISTMPLVLETVAYVRQVIENINACKNINSHTRDDVGETSSLRIAPAC